jgi:hypothetical protein
LARLVCINQSAILMINRIARILPLFIVLALWALLPSCGDRAGVSLVFKEAYLSKTSLMDLANNNGSVGVRIYNAARSSSDANGTVLAIGLVALKGKENSGTSFDKRYRLFDKLLTGSVAEQQLNKVAAQTDVRYIAVGKDRFCVEFDRTAILTLLASADCNAVKVESLPSGANFTMKLTAVKIVNGAAISITGVSPIQATDPCPLNCGEPASLYLW